MSEASSSSKKKLLENPFLSSAVVPTAIVLVAVLIIWGLTQLLSGERDYRQLVEEMQSKTFGNRWVAAFELSKVLANKKVPPEDHPWLIENLQKIYLSNADPRTRNFLIMALASLEDPQTLPFLEQAVLDTDPQVKFSAVVSLGKFPPHGLSNPGPLLSLLKHEDPGLVQAALFALAHQQVPQALGSMQEILNSSDPSLKYAAATALIAFKDETALPVLREILLQPTLKGNFNSEQTLQLKLRVVDALRFYQWAVLNKELGVIAENGPNLKLSTSAQATLNFLKN